MKISTLVASALVASATAADYIMWNAPSVTLDNADLWGKSIFVSTSTCTTSLKYEE